LEEHDRDRRSAEPRSGDDRYPDGHRQNQRVARPRNGFSYALGFDDRKETDSVLAIDGVDFLVDKYSAPYLVGAEVDFVDGLSGAGFKIGNPNAKSTCGCGESFGV
jgi:iron-sulfur cluster assembly accessory protein